MTQLIYVLLASLIIVIIIISTPSSKEFFTVNKNRLYLYNFRYPNKYYRYCKKCDNMNPYNCKSCVNCGLCYEYDGTVSCVPGTIDGPYFRKDCQYWKY